MAANITDLLSRVTDSTTGRPVIASLASPGKAIGAVSVTLNDTTNWTTTTAIHFSIYNTTAAGIKDPTTQTDWKGTLSGTTISGLTLTGGTDQAYSAGAKVELTPTARWSKDLYDNISAHANQDGSLKTSAVQNALNIAATSTDWTPLANVPTVVSSNGQKETVLQFTGVNYTDRLQPGTKLQVPRSVTPPTQSMAFAAASSQYATKASPTGITFTSAFTCEAWIYLNSYTSTNQGILSRTDGTNGFTLFVNGNDGRLGLAASLGTSFNQISYRSLPLKEWVHVAGTFSAGTFFIYINGKSVPALQTGSGSTVTQAGSLQVGAYNSGQFLDGYVSEARIWSVAQTQSAIQNNMGISLTGSETNLVALFQGNGNFNDKTSNANNLTAAGGAIATQAANPYSATEYAIVTALNFTSGNTQVTVFTGQNVIPNATLGTASYSSARAPYGFPVSRGKWSVRSIFRTQQSLGTGTNGTWMNGGGVKLTVPTGEWVPSYKAVTQVTSGSTSYIGAVTTLSNATNTQVNPEYTVMGTINVTASTEVSSSHSLPASAPIFNTTATDYYLNVYPNVTGSVVYFNGTSAPIVLTSECAYI